ncbi:MAG TPA: cold-shock protein [Xanthobacteraceae bacterium]|nr:cold-shock protein [Xanthobacteraceae bacterium]
MGRGKNFDRGSRRYDVEDDDRGMPMPSFRRPSGPPRAAAEAPSGPEQTATVKWFNGEKGFGFVALSDGSGDVFLHVRVLEAAGVSTLDPGTTLTVQVGPGQKGQQVTRVIDVDTSTATPEQPRSFARNNDSRGDFRNDNVTVEAVRQVGRVKWFDMVKGFGFIAPEDGSKDVFVHISAVERAGLNGLSEGQLLEFDVTVSRGKSSASNLKVQQF